MSPKSNKKRCVQLVGQHCVARSIGQLIARVNEPLVVSALKMHKSVGIAGGNLVKIMMPTGRRDSGNSLMHAT